MLKIDWLPLPDPWHNRVVLYAIGLFLALLPFQLIFPPITAGIVAVGLAVVLRFRPAENAINLKGNRPLRIWLGLFALLLIGLLYTHNLKEAGRDITLKISLLLFPLAFAALPKIEKKHALLSFNIFLVALALADTIALGIAFANYLETTSTDWFFYDKLTFSKMVSVHHFSLYNSFGAIILIDRVIRAASAGLSKKLTCSVWQWAGILLFCATVALLSVRIQYLALLSAVAVLLLYHRKFLLKQKWIAFSLLVVLLSALSSVTFMEGPNQRLEETVDEWRSLMGIGQGKQTNPRFYLWPEAKKVIEANFVFGTGTGSANDALQEKIEALEVYYWVGDKNVSLASFRFNYHNEFLQHFATHGIIGFALLLLLFIWPLTQKKLRNQPLIGAFLLLTFLSFLTESMLERQAGVLFFGFFYSFLITNQENAIAA